MAEPKGPLEAELEAMRKIVETLEPLESHQRTRVLAAVLCLQDVDLAQKVMSSWRAGDL